MRNKQSCLIILFIIMMSYMLCACSVEANNYPLLVDDGGTGESGFCNNEAGTLFSLSILFISNVGKQPITIDRVALIDEENMTIIESSLMVIGEERTLLGFQYWPPVSTERYPNFDTRIPAAGAVIEPGDGFNLLVAVELHEAEAYASGLEISYRNLYGRKYVEKSYYAYVFNNDGLREN